MKELATYSDRIKTLTLEIKQYQDNVCLGMIEIGNRLIEIKKELGHGNWLPYVEKELGYGNRTASRLIRVAKESKKFDIEKIANLKPTIFSEILSLPSEIRDEVVNGLNTSIESLSVREFKVEVDKIKNKRKSIPSATKKSLSARSGGKCEICGWGNEYMAGVLVTHHIVEHHKTQDDSLDNLVMICPNCHNIIHKVKNCSDSSIKNGILSSLDKNTYNKIIKLINMEESHERIINI